MKEAKTTVKVENHTGEIRTLLDDVAQRARDQIPIVDEPRAQALFETTAEVLEGLAVAYRHYEEGTEPAWRR